MKRRTDRRKLVRLLATATAAGLLCWGGGFLWFRHLITLPPAPPPHVDGIVALTGGAGRVEYALHLLARGQADKLLVSGIGGNTDLATLGRLARMDVSPLEPMVTLGRHAASTRGNAIESAAWAAQNGIRSIIVVTAAYHMPRALAELRQTLPGVRLFPMPVEQPIAAPLTLAQLLPARMVPAELAPAQVYTDRGPSLRLQAEEYTKYVLVLAGLSGWFPQRETAAAAASPVSANE